MIVKDLHVHAQTDLRELMGIKYTYLLWEYSSAVLRCQLKECLS